MIDFGLAKSLQDGELASTIAGTPEYMAPEVLERTGHDFGVDWWAIGVLMYEMLIGVTPFFNKNKNMLHMKIKNAKVVFPDRAKYKIDYSDGIVDVIRALLQRDKKKRLGAQNGFVEVLSHPYFIDVDLKAIESKSMKPPFMPNFGKKDLKEFFNVSQDAADLADTYVPRENQRYVSKNADQFKEFAKNFASKKR